MRFTTNAPQREVAALAPEARQVEHERGVTTFVVSDRDAGVVVSELERASWRIWPGHPHATGGPRGYGTASSHIRLR